MLQEKEASSTIEPDVATTVSEMQLILQAQHSDGLPSNVQLVRTKSDFDSWCKVADQSFQTDAHEIHQGMEALWALDSARLILYVLDGVPLGTACIHVDYSKLSGVYSVGVLDEYRSRDIGGALMTACLALSYDLGATDCALFSASANRKLFEKCDFKEKPTMQLHMLMPKVQNAA